MEIINDKMGRFSGYNRCVVCFSFIAKCENGCHSRHNLKGKNGQEALLPSLVLCV